MSVYVPCANGGAGEVVYLSGLLHVKLSWTVNDNNYHITSHYQPMGVTGVGQTTGDRYQATGVTRTTDSASFAGYPWTNTYVNNFRIIGPGPGNNLVIHYNSHVTINANGEITAYVDNYRADCK